MGFPDPASAWCRPRLRGRSPFRGQKRRRVEKVVGYPPLVEMDDRQRREFHEALLDADSFEDPELRRQPPRLPTRARGRSAARSCAASALLVG